jgi:hypothetical protein
MSVRNGPARRVLLPLGAVLAVAAVLVAAFGAMKLRDRDVARDRGILGELTLSAGAEQQCGAKALFLAMSRAAMPVLERDVEELLFPGPNGVSFGRIQQAATKLGCNTSLSTLNWESLLAAATPSVLWVNDNHFFAVDPREPDAGQSGPRRVRVYDSDTPGQWWTRAQLEAVWKGPALTVRPGAVAASGGGPKIRWDRCTEDPGYVKSDDFPTYRFECRNDGDAPLTLNVAASGCSCATAEFDRESVPPGGKAVLTVHVDTRAKRGFFLTSVLVASNDPAGRFSHLYMRGGVQQTRLTSTDTLHFGSVSRGSSAERIVCVYNTGADKLELVNAGVKVDALHGVGEGVRGAARVKQLDRSAPSVAAEQAFPLPLTPGDYAVTVRIEAAPDCPPGPFKGEARISVRQGDQVRDVTTVLEGQVETDVVAVPRSLLVKPGESEEFRAQVTLTRPKAGGVTVRDVTVRGTPAPVLASWKQTPGAAGTRVDVRFASPAARDIPQHGMLVIDLGNREQVTLPVIVSSP